MNAVWSNGRFENVSLSIRSFCVHIRRATCTIIKSGQECGLLYILPCGSTCCVCVWLLSDQLGSDGVAAASCCALSRVNRSASTPAAPSVMTVCARMCCAATAWNIHADVWKKKDFGWLSSLHLASTEHIVTNLVFFRHLSLLLWDSNLGTHRSPRSLGILHQNQLWWLLRHRQERASSSCNSNTLKCKIAKKKTQYLKPKNCCLSIFK